MVLDGKSICLNVGFGPLAPHPSRNCRPHAVTGPMMWRCSSQLHDDHDSDTTIHEYLNEYVHIGYTATLLFAWDDFIHSCLCNEMYLTHICTFQSWKNWGPLKYKKSIKCWNRIGFILPRNSHTAVHAAISGTLGWHGPSRLSCPFAAQIKEAGGTVKQLKSRLIEPYWGSAVSLIKVPPIRAPWNLMIFFTSRPHALHDKFRAGVLSGSAQCDVISEHMYCMANWQSIFIKWKLKFDAPVILFLQIESLFVAIPLVSRACIAHLDFVKFNSCR